MRKSFKYDVVSLIELVESEPCLWDKAADCFKDKIEKQKAWNEVYAFLDDDFLQKGKKEQQKIGEVITAKWQNVRDSFVKSLKKKSGQATAKKYIYHDNLTFLLKVVQSDDTHSSINDSQQLHEIQDDGEAVIKVQVQAQENVSVTAREVCNLRKKARMQENIDREILEALINPPGEDEAFFISITPSVRKMSDEDKLEFRMNVLQLIKDINSRINNNPRIPLACSSCSSSTTTSRTSKPLSKQNKHKRFI